ncbi:GntP family permease (plasmid) [Fusobacteria bacterium ZRK30]|nr:GntP family permease [Fusobacteria bacterium ZRK30]
MDLGLIGIIISLGLLMYLAYKGVPVIVLAPVLAIFAVFMNGLATGNMHIMINYTNVFMVKMGGFIISNFPLFLLGAIFGRLMTDTGSAEAISKFICRKLGKNKAVLATVLSTGILTYGGVSAFVVVFCILPIGCSMFKEAGIPKRFLPGSIALGAFTFAMTALPGTPQVQNLIPMKYFGTDSYASPILGLIAAAIMFGGGMLWLTMRTNKAMATGEGYGDHKENHSETQGNSKLPNILVSILPIILVLLFSLILSKVIFPDANLKYLELYGTTPSKVIGSWSIIISLTSVCLLMGAYHHKNIDNIIDTFDQGAKGALTAIMNTGSEVGYGAVVASLAAFAIVKTAMMGLSPNPLINGAVASSVLAGVTGSASGGLGIALGALGSTMLEQANAAGISPQALHKIATVACGGLDTLPHNGAVITLLTVCGLTHRESYLDIGVNTVAIPLFATVVIIALGSMGLV